LKAQEQSPASGKELAQFLLLAAISSAISPATLFFSKGGEKKIKKENDHYPPAWMGGSPMYKCYRQRTAPAEQGGGRVE
jgi:hypothetical protein